MTDGCSTGFAIVHSSVIHAWCTCELAILLNPFLIALSTPAENENLSAKMKIRAYVQR